MDQGTLQEKGEEHQWAREGCGQWDIPVGVCMRQEAEF